MYWPWPLIGHTDRCKYSILFNKVPLTRMNLTFLYPQIYFCHFLYYLLEESHRSLLLYFLPQPPNCLTHPSPSASCNILTSRQWSSPLLKWTLTNPLPYMLHFNIPFQSADKSSWFPSIFINPIKKENHKICEW